MANSGALQINSFRFISPKDVYEAYLNNEDLNDYFYDHYGVSYHFLFGDTKPDKFITSILKSAYRNDYFIRYSFFNDVLLKKKAVSFFELPLGDSRADVVSVNGKSSAFEIKTDYDSLDRLIKQLADYSKAFEYVYVLCSDKRAKAVAELIPDYCGIYSYKSSGRMSFKLLRPATLSPNLNSCTMIDLMLKKEMTFYFGTTDKKNTLSSNSFEHINKCFKEAVTKRFAGKMEHISMTCDCLL